MEYYTETHTEKIMKKPHTQQWYHKRGQSFTACCEIMPGDVVVSYLSVDLHDERDRMRIELSNSLSLSLDRAYQQIKSALPYVKMSLNV